MMIQTFFEKAGKWSCLALCYLQSMIDKYMEGKEDAKTAILCTLLVDAWANKKGIDDEFFVYDPVCLLTRAGANFNLKLKVDVKKKTVNSIADLADDAYNCVEFRYNNVSHFVLYKGKAFIFNGLENSNSFRYGKPVSVREVRYA